VLIIRLEPSGPMVVASRCLWFLRSACVDNMLGALGPMVVASRCLWLLRSACVDNTPGALRTDGSSIQMFMGLKVCLC
jgi:hypothetical protein